MTLLAIWLIGVAVVLVVNLYLNGRKWDEFWQWGKDQDDAYWNFTWALIAKIVLTLLVAGTWPISLPLGLIFNAGRWHKRRDLAKTEVRTEVTNFQKAQVRA